MEKRIYRSGSKKPLKTHPLKLGEFGSIKLYRLIGSKETVIPGGDGFELLLSVAKPGGGFRSFSRPEKEVFICYKGIWKVDWSGNAQKGSYLLNEGDLFSLPSKFDRSIECIGKNEGYLYSIVNDNSPTVPIWSKL